MTTLRRKLRSSQTSPRRISVAIVQHATTAAALAVILLSEVSSMYQSHHSLRGKKHFVVQGHEAGLSPNSTRLSEDTHVAIGQYEYEEAFQKTHSEHTARPMRDDEETPRHDDSEHVTHSLEKVDGEAVISSYSGIQSDVVPNKWRLQHQSREDTRERFSDKTESVSLGSRWAPSPWKFEVEESHQATLKSSSDALARDSEQDLEQTSREAKHRGPNITTQDRRTSPEPHGTQAGLSAASTRAIEAKTGIHIPVKIDDTVVPADISTIRKKTRRKNTSMKMEGKGNKISKEKSAKGSAVDATPDPESAVTKFRGVQMDPIAVAKAEAMGNFDNVTHLSFMLYRVIKTHRMRSILDVACSHTLHWMPQVLHYIELEVPSFRYHCVLPNVAERDQAVAAFSGLASTEFVVAREYWRVRLPTSDVGFLWSVIGFMPPQQAWALLQGVRRAGTKYLILGNYPSLRNNPAAGTSHGRVNVRRAPYRFTEALRVFNNMSTRADINKQMLLYDSEQLRADDL